MKNYIILFLTALMVCGVMAVYATINRYEVTKSRDSDFMMIVDKWQQNVSFYNLKEWPWDKSGNYLKYKTQSIKTLTK